MTESPYHPDLISLDMNGTLPASVPDPGSISTTFASKTTTNQSAMLLDNVRVELVSIPEPSAAILMGAAAFALMTRRSRR